MTKGDRKMKKSLSVILIMVLVISMAANFFSFNKLTSAKEETTQQAKLLLEEKEQEIGKLNDEISSLKKEKNSAASNKNTEETKEAEKPASPNNLLNAANHFVDYMYNVSPENFVTVKQNADQYMTDELAETLFPSGGIDEAGSDLRTSADNIKVFGSEEDKQAIVSYDFELEMLSNGHTERDTAYVLFTFEDSGGTYKVSSIEPINNLKGEISSIDAIGYIKGGGILP